MSDTVLPVIPTTLKLGSFSITEKLFRAELALGSDKRSAAGRQVESEVFFEAFGNTPETLDAEYSEYEPLTAWVTIFDVKSNRPAGAARLLFGHPLELKSVRDLALQPWGKNPQKVLEETSPLLLRPHAADVATLGVAKEYRGRATNGIVSMALYRACLRLIEASGVDTMVAVFDIKVLNLINRLFQQSWSLYPGVVPGEYLGSSVSAPAWCSLSNLKARTLAATPELYSKVFEDPAVDSVEYFDWEAAKITLEPLL